MRFKKKYALAVLLVGLGVFSYFHADSGAVERIRSYIVEETSETPVQPQKTVSQRKILLKYSKLYEINNDLVGYIYLDKDHECPIVQKKDDQNYYLYRDFFGNDDKSGTVFLNRACALGDQGISLVYGHHMKDGSMFGSVSELQPQDRIQLDTIFAECEYEVAGSCVCNLNDDFKYYNYVGKQSSYSFEVWRQNMSKRCIRGSLDSLAKDDVIVELSTCSYAKEGDRLVVILKGVGDDDVKR